MAMVRKKSPNPRRPRTPAPTGEELIGRAERWAQKRFEALRAELLPAGLRDALDVTDLKAVLEKQKAAASEAAGKEAQHPQREEDDSSEVEDLEQMLEGHLPQMMEQVAMAGAGMLQQLVLKASESKVQIDRALEELRMALRVQEASRVLLEEIPDSKGVEKLRAFRDLTEAEALVQSAHRHAQRTIEFAQTLIRQARSITEGGGGMIRIFGFGPR